MTRYSLVIRDDRGTRRIELATQEVVRLGRSGQNDCLIDARGVSRNHALLIKAESGWKLVDLKSSNASFVGGEPVREASLKPGDEIRIGMARLYFLNAGDPGPAPRPARRKSPAAKKKKKTVPPVAPGVIRVEPSEGSGTF